MHFSLWQQKREIATEQVEKLCCAFYHNFLSNLSCNKSGDQVAAVCVNTRERLTEKKIMRQSHHTRQLRHLLKNKFALTLTRSEKRPACADIVAKRTTFRNLQQPGLLQEGFFLEFYQRFTFLTDSMSSNG